MSGRVDANLEGKTCLVTGASSGIGKEVARELARMGARVVLGCRSGDRAEAARRDIASTVKGAVLEIGLVDVSSQRSVREFVGSFSASHPSLDVLVNNAGIWAGRRQASAEGIELTWATNVLGYFLMTDLLLPLLKRPPKARVVSVASEFAGDLDLGDVEFRRRSFSGVKAYRQSKQANRMWTWALARRLEGTGITANAVHPGGVATELFAKAGGVTGFVTDAWARMSLRTPAEGASTVVWLAASPDLEGLGNRFWVDRAEKTCAFRGVEAEERLFRLCAEMTAL